MDAALVARVRGVVTRGVIAATVAWLILSATGDTAQWGLYDPEFAHRPSQEGEDALWD
eukprot:gene703-27495_t